MIARLLAVLFALCLTSAAEAQTQNFWSSPGSGCVPDEATIKFDRHKVDNLSVRHAQNNLDPIILICPIQPFSSAEPSWVLALSYQDSTGTGPSAFIRAQLYQLEIGTAKPVLLATANSNSSAVTTFNIINSAVFTNTFDFDTHLYWVRVHLDRSATDQTVIFYYAFLAAV
jgi:hypothetical protein